MSSKLATQVPADSRRIAELKSEIRDLGDWIDSYKAKTAGAMGGGVFLLLLGLGGGYDLLKGNQSISIAVGVTQDVFKWVVVGAASVGLFLLIVAFRRESRRDRAREARLARLEQELADLLEEAGSS